MQSLRARDRHPAAPTQSPIPDALPDTAPTARPTLTPTDYRAIAALAALHLFILSFYAYALFYILPTRIFLYPLALALVILSQTAVSHAISPIHLLSYQFNLAKAAQHHPICRKCNHPRPPRTHHCSQCNHCIPRMSHHCGVLSVCLGAHNMKPFLLLLFYGCVSAAISFACNFSNALHLVTTLYNRQLRLTISHVLQGQVLYFQLAFAIAMLGLLLYHCYYIATGWTILEATTTRPVPRLFPPWHRTPTRFDNGFFSNLEQVFGTGYAILQPKIDVSRLISDANRYPSEG